MIKIKPSTLFARAVNEEFHRNSGNHAAAWATCANRTYPDVYAEMMGADSKRRADIANEAKQVGVRTLKDIKAILEDQADQIAEFHVAMTGEGWADWVESNQGRFTGRAASTVFSGVVERLQQKSRMTYSTAWDTGRRKFRTLYEGMSK